MNNYETLPEFVQTDIDIIIDSKTFEQLDRILFNFCIENQAEITQKIWGGYKQCAYIISPIISEKEFGLQVDFFTDFSPKGLPKILTNEYILRGRRKYKNFYIPSPETEVQFILIKRIVKNDLKEKHIDTLNKLISSNKLTAQTALSKLFTDSCALSLMEFIESGDESIFLKNFNSYLKAIRKKCWGQLSFLAHIQILLAQTKRILNRFLHPVGLTVALQSPDGGGKTTIGNQVLERVSCIFHGRMIEYGRPNYLPPMGRLKFWNPSMEIVTNPQPHNHPIQNPIKSFLRFLYYVMDYILGYPLKIYPAKVRKNIIIFDRYYYDYLVDLRRYQFNIPSWIPKLLLPIIPSPDLTIYLEANPNELFRRKQELPPSELQRQTKEFSKILHQIPNCYRVETSISIEDTVKRIAHLILRKKALQTKEMLNIAR